MSSVVIWQIDKSLSVSLSSILHSSFSVRSQTLDSIRLIYSWISAGQLIISTSVGLQLLCFLCGGISESIWSFSSASPVRFSDVFSSILPLASSPHIHQWLQHPRQRWSARRISEHQRNQSEGLNGLRSDHWPVIGVVKYKSRVLSSSLLICCVCDISLCLSLLFFFLTNLHSEPAVIVL